MTEEKAAWTEDGSPIQTIIPCFGADGLLRRHLHVHIDTQFHPTN